MLCSVSFCLSQTLTEPAIFARETGCDCQAPHEKLTIVQAQGGTPGTAPSLLTMKQQFVIRTGASITV